MSSTPTKVIPKIWIEEFKVHSYEIGASGYASPQSLCQFLQEAASNHAAQLDFSAEEMARTERMWVLSQMSVRMESYPRWHDTITIETWPVAKGKSLRGYRDFILTNSAQQRIGRASTMWLMLNSETKKPLKLPAELANYVSPGFENEILNPLKESEFTGEANVVQEFLIRASDIDWNMHVNNVCYLEWALEAVPPRFRLSNQIAELDISFISEGKYGSTVIAECFEQNTCGVNGDGEEIAGNVTDFRDVGENSIDEQTSYLHRIREKESQRVMALLRTKWCNKSRKDH